MGYDRAACVAFELQLRVTMTKTDLAYNGTGMVTRNAQPMYIYVTMSSGLNESALQRIPVLDDTWEELKNQPGVRLYKVKPGQTRVINFPVKSVRKYLAGQWKTDSTSAQYNELIAPMLNQPVRRWLAQDWNASTNQFRPFDPAGTSDEDDARQIKCSWGFWYPNVNEDLYTHTLEFSTSMKITQKVKFFRSKAQFGFMDETDVA